MRHCMNGMLVALAALALSAVSTAPAVALPEVGRSVAQAGSARYEDANCTQKALFDADCHTKGASAGELISSRLKGHFAYVSGKGTTAPVVGELLSPEAGGAFREWECPAIGVSVYEGQGPEKGHATLVGDVGPVNTMSTAFTARYAGSNGIQSPQAHRRLHRHLQPRTVDGGQDRRIRTHR
jgi:hypothetical protein